MDPRLKEVEYQGFVLSHNGRIAYAVIEKEVFFSGLIRGVTTTINAAEAVVKAICEAEKIRWQDYTFIDIQTHCGYHKAPGEFEVDVLGLGIGEELIVQSWQSTSLTEEVRQLFDELIG